MTNRRTAILALAALTLLVPALASPRAAAAWVSVRGAFSVGGVLFDLGWVAAPRTYGVPASPYYRVAAPLSHPVYRCSSACYRAGGAYYHDASCPVVLHYFRSYGYAPPRVGLSLGYGGVPVRPYVYGAAPRPYVVYRAPAPYFIRRVPPGHHAHRDRWDGRRDRRDGRHRARPRHHW